MLTPTHGKPLTTIRQLNPDDPTSWAVFMVGNDKPLSTGLTKALAREHRKAIARTMLKRGRTEAL